MTDKPTREELAAAFNHDPKTCHVCCNPNIHGDQAPDPLELENDALREQVATLTAERDAARLAVDVEREMCAQLIEEANVMPAAVLSTTARELLAAAIRARKP